MTVWIENLQDKVECSVTLNQILETAVQLSLESEGFGVPSEISILLVDDEEIRKINKEQRKIDKATDVLSFPIVDMVDGEIMSDEGDFDLEKEALLLGDIVISLETAKRQAEEYGHSFDREVAFLTTHGVFHLLGYDHMEEDQEKRMMGKQENVLVKMGLSR